MRGMAALLTDHEITERVLSHIANRSTDTGAALWREPVENYRSKQRFDAEMQRVLRRSYTAFCPSAALPEAGSFIARDAGRRRARPRRRGASVSERVSPPGHAHRGGQWLCECIRLPVSRLDLRAGRQAAAHSACRRLPGTRQESSWSRAAARGGAAWTLVHFAGAERAAARSCRHPGVVR